MFSRRNYMWAIVLLLLLSSACTMDESNVNIDDLGIDIRVDPTVELFCTIHRLAETSHPSTQT